MKELSLSILDIARNSIEAGASNITIELDEGGEPGIMTVIVDDDGPGIPPDLLSVITDPFATTRKTRPVGMGIPLYKQAAEMTGGSFSISNLAGSGASVQAVFHTEHIDMPPMGNIWDTVAALISGSPDKDFLYIRRSEKAYFELNTKELRDILDGVPLDDPEIISWITDYVKEHETQMQK